MQLILLVFLGLTAVFSVAAFASQENPVERPIVGVVCKIRPQDLVCASPTPTPQPELPPISNP